LKGVPNGSALWEAFNGQFSSREKFYSRIQNYSGDTYYNARKSFLSIAYQYETSKVTSFVLQDKEQTCAVALSVIAHPVFLKKKEVLSDIDKLKIGIPCIFRQNKRDNLDPNDPDFKKWICLAQSRTSKMAQITCTPEEQDLILIHLRYNASKLSESCRDRFMKMENYINTFTFSYVSPMFENPVAKANVAKANEAQICPKCGVNEASLTCSRCKIQNYCSKACQKRDWKEHKQICRKPESKLDNSDYIDVDVGKIDPMFESMHGIVVSYDANAIGLKKMTKGKKMSKIGKRAMKMSKDAMFLVKVQINTQGDPFAMPIMVYDKSRKVQAYVTMANALGGVGKLVNGVKILGIKGIELGMPVPYGIKGYFHAYLHESEEGASKGKTLLRIMLDKSFPNPGW
jgi:hypothetical protein